MGRIASLRCSSCDDFRGWLSEAIAKALIEIVHFTGRPTAVIEIRNITGQSGKPGSDINIPTTTGTIKMHISKMFPSKYLKAVDIEGDHKIIVSRVVEEEVGKDKTIMPVMYFKGWEKGLILNKTNSDAFAKVYGDDTDFWVGKSAIMFTMPITYEGKTVEGIRFRFPGKGNSKR
jgi:hypothetical protein